MADILKPLGFALALAALGAPALAQDAQPTGDAAPATDAAPVTDAAPAAEPAPAADATPALDLGQDANAAPADAATYVAEVFDDWHRECVRAPQGGGEDHCYIAQLLREKPDDPEPLGKISIRRLPAGAQAQAYAEVIMPLGVVLPEHLVIQIDGGQAKVYDFRFCLPLGCVARLGFTAGDVAAFKAGAQAKVIVAAEGEPGKPVNKVEIPMSLKGFTAGYDSLTAPAQ